MPESARSIAIRMLGGFEVRIQGATVDEGQWGRRKAKALVKILALEPGREKHRDELIELLWPEAEPESGLNSFHKTLHAARRAFGDPGYLVMVEQRVRLEGDVRTDVAEFETAVAAEQWERAVELYGGQLLPDDRYEDWAARMRERLQQKHEVALMRLERWADVLAANPSNEVAHRALMKKYAESGERHRAVQQYRLVVDSLKRDLDVAPESETVRLYEQIVAGEISAVPSRAVPEPISRRQWGRWAIGASLAAVVGYPAWRWVQSREKTGKQIVDSLAVLPLEAKTADLEYLADGATEGVIHRLSRLPGLRVMARSTVFTYKGKRTDPREAGRQMSVRAVLTGRVVELGSKLAVSVEVVDVADGAQLWGQQYTFEPGEVVTLQSRISTEIAGALQLRLQQDQQRRLERNETESAGAYRSYLLGRYEANRRTERALRTAVDHFEKAIAQDPGYALAYTGLADTFGLLGFQYVPPPEVLPRARAMVKKALELDPALAEAHTSLGMVKALYEWDWPGAEESFRRAIELNPGYVTAHHWFGVHLNAKGRGDEARRELARALELDPLSRIILVNRGYPDHYDRKYAAAIRAYQSARDLDPAFPVSHDDLMLAYEQTGQWRSALEEAKEADDLLLRETARKFAEPVTEGSYRRMLRRWRDALVEQAAREYVSPIVVAQAAVRAGDREGCWRWFDRAVEERSAPLVYLRRDPMYDPVREDARFRRLLERVGL